LEPTREQIAGFRRRIFRFYRLRGRNLPWRKTVDPYCVTVAELMLQQTQVERVAPKYGAWIKRWPTWRALAKAAPRDILTAWSGLGYNRRALYLQQIAQAVVHDFGGVLPTEPEALRKLPGLGPYSANAILIFAFNRPLMTIDTNIRRVLLHEFDLPDTTTKANLEALARAVLPVRRSRDWHNALMDYSRLALPARLPGIRSGNRQSRFEGSLRQIRGEIVRQLTTRASVTVGAIARKLDRTDEDVLKAAWALERDGLAVLAGRRIMPAGSGHGRSGSRKSG
jgi:A/G-specific adenine glycosylase